MPSRHPRTRHPRGRAGSSALTSALAVALLFFVLLGILVALEKTPLWVLAPYGLLSVVAFFLYGADKSAAKRGEWRTPESTLLTVGVLGGWPGALVARHVFRHKTSKQPFRTHFWMTALVNCAGLACLLYVTGV